MNNEVYTRRVDTRIKLLGRILDAVARMKKGEDQHEVQNALKFTVEFSNICWEVQHTCHFCVINLSFKRDYITITITINSNQFLSVLPVTMGSYI